jgi:hypothetical protein
MSVPAKHDTAKHDTAMTRRSALRADRNRRKTPA